MGQASTSHPSEQAKRHLRELLHDFDTAMLVTHGSPGGPCHARPMAVAEIGEDCSVWFISRADAPKIDEIDSDREIAAVFQQPRKYLSVSGRAELHRDRARIQAVWQESFRPWFEGGKDDPNILLIRLNPSEAEYWDNTGAKGLRFALKEAAAYVSGRELTGPGDVSQHAKVQL
ncbi:MAG TPA: pyridoxamine 5'-phosphate oxidase family protein [Polyangiales bacterium]